MNRELRFMRLSVKMALSMLFEILAAKKTSAMRRYVRCMITMKIVGMILNWM
jgi:hypothetical protein